MEKQPKSIKSIRSLKKKQPHLIEGLKKTLFIRGNKTSNLVQSFMRNLKALRKQRAISYSRKHEFLPFDDHETLERYCQRAEANLFVFGSHSKKRPDNIIIGRLFDWKILDMVEFGLVGLQSMQQFYETCKISYQIQPFLVFQGDLWQTDQSCTKIRNLLTDFFYQNNHLSGIELDNLLQVVITFSILENTKIYMHVYSTRMQGQNLLEYDGKISIESLGPNTELWIRRSCFASDQLWKKSRYVPKESKKKQNKNVRYDRVGNRRGKLYIDRQDLKRIQSKKRKFIKKVPKIAKNQQEYQKINNQFVSQ